jgi:hypothetical protein
LENEKVIVQAFGGAGFSLRKFVLEKPKFRRLKPAPLKAASLRIALARMKPHCDALQRQTCQPLWAKC